MEDKFQIEGRIPLKGEVEISGYKNSAGACLAAILLSEKPSVIENLSRASDVLNQIEILKNIGVQVEWQGNNKAKFTPQNLSFEKIPYELFEKMRVSVLLSAPLLIRFKKIKIPHPGGDKIGLRPITTHLKALQDFGVKVEEENGFYFLELPDSLEGKNIILEEFSVTATEIALMIAASAKGKSTIEMAASEPQVQDLCNLLNLMGARIQGVGTHTLVIEGKKELQGAEFSICPDLLEAGTFLIAFAITQGEGLIKKVNPVHLKMFLKKMKEIGVNFEISDSEIKVLKSDAFKAAKIQVLPYPGFPTDLQPQTSVLLTQAQGKSLIHDPLYENRFQHLHELRKMGADIEITDPHRALIFGKTDLVAAKINSSDIRSGSALVLAALTAKNKSLVENIGQIERGYENLEGKLQKLGAKIEKI